MGLAVPRFRRPGSGKPESDPPHVVCSGAPYPPVSLPPGRSAGLRGGVLAWPAAEGVPVRGRAGARSLARMEDAAPGQRGGSWPASAACLLSARGEGGIRGEPVRERDGGGGGSGPALLPLGTCRPNSRGRFGRYFGP